VPNCSVVYPIQFVICALPTPHLHDGEEAKDDLSGETHGSSRRGETGQLVDKPSTQCDTKSELHHHQYHEGDHAHKGAGLRRSTYAQPIDAPAAYEPTRQKDEGELEKNCCGVAERGDQHHDPQGAEDKANQKNDGRVKGARDDSDEHRQYDTCSRSAYDISDCFVRERRERSIRPPTWLIRADLKGGRTRRLGGGVRWLVNSRPRTHRSAVE
jgi:hypothetical protein